MKSTRTRGIVLRRTNYGEADRIVLFLTPEHGLLSVIARGVRREKSKLAGGIELFGVCDVTLHTGKGDLAILTSARLETYFSEIIKDYHRLEFGYEAMKHIRRVAETIDDGTFYSLLEQTLQMLNKTDISLAIIKTWFWLQLAILLGTGVNLHTDDEGLVLKEAARYEFDTVHMALHVTETGRFTSRHIKLLRLLSARSPEVGTQVQDVHELIDDCLWLAERAVAH